MCVSLQTGVRSCARRRRQLRRRRRRGLDGVLPLKSSTRLTTQREPVCSGRGRRHEAGRRRWRNHRERVSSERRQRTEGLSVDDRRRTSGVTGRRQRRQRCQEATRRGGSIIGGWRRRLIVGWWTERFLPGWRHVYLRASNFKNNITYTPLFVKWQPWKKHN